MNKKYKNFPFKYVVKLFNNNNLIPNLINNLRKIKIKSYKNHNNFMFITLISTHQNIIKVSLNRN
jgi:hypothetical protein